MKTQADSAKSAEFKPGQPVMWGTKDPVPAFIFSVRENGVIISSWNGKTVFHRVSRNELRASSFEEHDEFRIRWKADQPTAKIKTELSDRGLLELAAKAAGITGRYVSDYCGDYYYTGNTEGIEYSMTDGQTVIWNPLSDDGDALRLAVKLEVDIYRRPNEVQVGYAPTRWYMLEVIKDGDRLKATRRAITRAAAAIAEAAAAAEKKAENDFIDPPF